jgi:biopolymer transport protein ExbB
MDLWKMNPWQVFVAGGPIMWPILLCSILAIGIIIERFWYLNSVKIDIRKLLEAIFDNIKNNRVKTALGLCEANRKTPVANVLKAGILKYDSTREEIKEAMEGAGLYAIPKLEKGLSMLATIAHISPLLGLLGTVTGMVRCFQTIQFKSASFVLVSPLDLAGGIWEALLTTVAGLMVAIPAFLAYNVLVSQVNNFILGMERAATELVNFLSQRSEASGEEKEP